MRLPCTFQAGTESLPASVWWAALTAFPFVLLACCILQAAGQRSCYCHILQALNVTVTIKG